MVICVRFSSCGILTWDNKRRSHAHIVIFWYTTVCLCLIVILEGLPAAQITFVIMIIVISYWKEPNRRSVAFRDPPRYTYVVRENICSRTTCTYCTYNFLLFCSILSSVQPLSTHQKLKDKNRFLANAWQPDNERYSNISLFRKYGSLNAELCPNVQVIFFYSNMCSILGNAVICLRHLQLAFEVASVIGTRRSAFIAKAHFYYWIALSVLGSRELGTDCMHTIILQYLSLT